VQNSKTKHDFRHFWPRYLDAHRHPYTRLAHYIATVIGLAAVVATLVSAEPLYVLIGIPAGYVIALSAHRWIEGHPSLIGVNALLGARADVYMCWLGLTGRLLAEYRRHGLVEPRTLFAPRRSTTLSRGGIGSTTH